MVPQGLSDLNPVFTDLASSPWANDPKILASAAHRVKGHRVEMAQDHQHGEGDQRGQSAARPSGSPFSQQYREEEHDEKREKKSKKSRK